MYRTILVIIIILSVMIFGYFVWPTPYLYTHTAQNILVKINRLTGETCYFIPGRGWEKVIEEKSSTKNNGPNKLKPYIPSKENEPSSSEGNNLLKYVLPKEEQSENEP